MKSFLAGLLHDATGRAFDEMALLCVIGVAAFIGLSIAAFWRGQPFDPQAYGTGLGLAIGAAATGMGIKSKLERPPGGG